MTRYVRGILLILIGLGIVGASQLDTFNQRRLISQYAVKMVTVNDDSMGSGSYVYAPSGRVIILTNWHICRHADAQKKVSYRLDHDVVVQTPYVKSDINVDLCAIYLPQEFYRQALQVAGRDAQTFEQVMVMGYPLDGPLTPSYGYYLITSVLNINMGPGPDGNCPPGIEKQEGFFGEVYCLKEYNLGMTSAVIYPGNSGSPLLNMRNELIGVMNSGDQRSNFGNFVQRKDVINFLKDL